MNIVVALAHLTRDTASAMRQAVHGVAAFFARIHQARLRAQTFQALAGLTDAELAERGLKREEIAFAVLDFSHLRHSS